MPYSYVVNAPGRVLFIRFWDVLTEDDLTSAAARALTDPAVGKDFNRIVNLTDVTEITVTPASLRRLADQGQLIPMGRRAIIATTPVIFGLARMFEQNLLLPEGSTGVFPDLPGALEFLGLDPSTPWPDE